MKKIVLILVMAAFAVVLFPLFGGEVAFADEIGAEAVVTEEQSNVALAFDNILEWLKKNVTNLFAAGAVIVSTIFGGANKAKTTTLSTAMGNYLNSNSKAAAGTGALIGTLIETFNKAITTVSGYISEMRKTRNELQQIKAISKTTLSMINVAYAQSDLTQNVKDAVLAEYTKGQLEILKLENEDNKVALEVIDITQNEEE